MKKWLHQMLVFSFLLVSLLALVSEFRLWNPLLSFLSGKFDGDETRTIVLHATRHATSVDTRYDDRALTFYATPYFFALQLTERLNVLDQEDGEFCWELPGCTIERDNSCFSSGMSPVCFKISELSLNYWVVALMAALYPAIFFIRSYRRRRLRRRALHPCRQCGYDLHGNESGVCPECGEVVEVTA